MVSKKPSQSFVELTVFEIWSKIFNDAEINVNATFTFLGGHSQEADFIYAKIKLEFDKHCQPRSTIAYDYPSIAQMSEHLWH